MVASTSSMAAMVALVTALLSTTALAAAPETGAALRAETGMAPPEVRPLPETTISGQRFAADDRVLELVLRDGTSLTLARGGALSIDEFAFDPAARIARLHLTLERGLLRIGGGRPAFAEPVVVTTPAGEAKLTQGVGLLSVAPDGTTRADLLTGGPLSLTAAGQTEEVVRPGFETLATRGAPPQSAERRAEGAMEFYMAELNPGLLTAISPDDGPPAPAGQATASTNTLANIQDSLSQTEIAAVQAGLGGQLASIDPTSGYGPASPVAGLNLVATLPSQADEGARSLAQSRDPSGVVVGQPDKPRDLGATTNRLYDSNETFTSDIESSPPKTIGGVVNTETSDKFITTDGSGSNLQYIFWGSAGIESAHGSDGFLLGDLGQEENIGFLKDGNLELAGPFMLTGNILMPDRGTVSTLQDTLTTTTDTGSTSTLFGDSTFRLLQSGFEVLSTNEQLNNTIWSEILLFDENASDNSNSADLTEVVSRESDNFILLEARPLVATPEGRDKLRDALNNESLAGGLGIDNDGHVIDGSGYRFLQIFRSTDCENFVCADLSSDEQIALAEALVDAFKGDESQLENRIKAISQDLLKPAQRDQLLKEIHSKERFIFATGDIDNPPDTERRLDKFFISPGLEGFEQKDQQGKPTVADTIRAFLRNKTAFRNEDGTDGLQLADTGLLIIGTPAGSRQGAFGQGGNEQTGVLHADFGISGLPQDDQPPPEQRSTISATIGQVRYDVDINPSDQFTEGQEVVLDAHTVGSTRGPADNSVTSASEGSVLTSSDIGSTSAGGGNDAIGRDGRAGYFVLENFNPPDETGGVERPLTASPTTDKTQETTDKTQEQQFAVLRLATGVESERLDVTADEKETTEFRGFAAGLGEAQIGQADLGVFAFDTGNSPDGFILRVSPQTNRMEGVYKLTGLGPLTMGGLTGDGSRGASAYIDQDRFGARTVDGSGADAAMVSGELLRQAANAEGSTANADTKAFLNAMPKTKDLKWGFFFGDLEPTDAGLRRHIHLGTWVAGNVPDGSRLPAHGTARYEGGAIGNVVNAGALYSAAGKYTNTWNFGSRAGLTELNFDGARMTGFTQQQGSRAVFTGGLSGNGRTAGIAGSFVQGAEPPGVPPAGQMGRFTVSGNNYGAAGVFGATRQ